MMTHYANARQSTLTPVKKVRNWWPMDTLKALRETGFFRGLSDDALRRLAACCAPTSVPKREYLFHEGRKGSGLFVLQEGRLQLVKTAADGREVVVRTVDEGETFAEVMLFEADVYPVSAVALSRSVVLRVGGSDLLRLLDDRAFRTEFLRLLFRRMRYLAERILYLTTCDVEARFFGFLRERYGEREHYALTMSKKDIASAIATTPESLSRLIDRLRRERRAQWAGKTVRLKAGFWAGYDAG